MSSGIRCSFRSALVLSRLCLGLPLRAPLGSCSVVGSVRAVRAHMQRSVQISVVRGFKTFKSTGAAKGQKRKVRSSVKKRFRVTGKGQIKFKRAGMRHNLGSKTKSHKSALHKKVCEVI